MSGFDAPYPIAGDEPVMVARPPLPRDVRPSRDRDNRYGVIVRELIEPTYGHFKVIARVDGLFAVLDLEGPLDDECPLFATEEHARTYASRRADAKEGT